MKNGNREMAAGVLLMGTLAAILFVGKDVTGSTKTVYA